MSQRWSAKYRNIFINLASYKASSHATIHVDKIFVKQIGKIITRMEESRMVYNPLLFHYVEIFCHILYLSPVDFSYFLYFHVAEIFTSLFENFEDHHLSTLSCRLFFDVIVFLWCVCVTRCSIYCNLSVFVDLFEHVYTVIIVKLSTTPYRRCFLRLQK